MNQAEQKITVLEAIFGHKKNLFPVITAYLLIIFFCSIVSAQTPLTLEVGKPLERELKAGETHIYQIELKAGEFLNAAVNQRGIDVIVRIFAPDNSKIAEIDSPNGDQGDEPVMFEAKTVGVYRIEVVALEKDAPTGHYEIHINQLLSAEQNAARIAEIRRKQQSVIKWLKDNSIRLKTVEAGNGFADLQPLKKVLKDVRFVGLGEQTHGTREFFQFKHRMVEFLVKEMNFRVFAIEASYSACQNINDYVMGKTDDGAKALDSQGFWTWNTEEVRAMIDWMREYNKSVPADKRVKFVGFDIQNNPVGQARLFEYLNRIAPKKAADYTELLKADLGQLFEDIVVADKKKEAAATLENLRRKANDLYIFLDLNSPNLETKSNASEHAEMRELARVIAQNIDSYYTNGETAGATLRDLFMADNFRRIAAREPAGTRFVLWAHNGHLIKSDHEGNYPTLGYYLERFYGKDYYALGFSFNRGAFQARVLQPDTIQRTLTGLTLLTTFTVGDAPAESGDWYLAQTGQKMFIVDFRSSDKNADVIEWLAAPHQIRFLGSFYAPDRERNFTDQPTFSKDYDGLFFIDTTTRARPNPSVKNVAQTP